jgi:hypothetical protein
MVNMITFIFWNLKNKSLENVIARIAKTHNVDIFIFAECAFPPERLLSVLNAETTEYHYSPGYGCDKIEIFTRFSRKFILPVYEDHRLTIRHLALPGSIDVLLSAIHFPSKIHWKGTSQAAECFNVSFSIKREEEKIGHSRTILVGDLNMNPFEEGVVNANGLHGVMSRQIAQRKTRTIQKNQYPYFYNPMWSLFGDISPGPPGTYYSNRAEHTEYFWHMFDQVLIRPDLLEVFNSKELRILSSIGNQSLLSAHGVPDKKAISDHLPLLFKVHI